MKDRRPIRQRLADYYTEAELDRWLYSPHPQLGRRLPVTLVDQGCAEEVHQIIDRLDAGTYL